MAKVNRGRTSNQSKTLFHRLTKGNSLKNSSIYGIRTSPVGAGSGSEDCIMDGDSQSGGGDSGHERSDIGSNYISGCSGLGVGSETGSGEDGSGDCIMNTSDSGAGGGGSSIAHTKGTGNNGYSGGESGASVAPTAAVDHFTPKTDLNPVIAVVAASTAPNVSSVAFAACAGANDNGSGWGNFEKPLDMQLAEELEMWKEKQIDSMDEGAQEDEQFELQIDSEETGRSESSSASENSEEEEECLKCESDPNRVEWVSGTLVQGQHAKDEVRKMRNRQGIQKSSLVEEESDMKRNELKH